MKPQIQLSVTLALITALGFGFNGCGSSSGGTTPDSSTATDITVERGKVYNATVVDSSTPVKTATQKANLNIYTFASAPNYPVIVTGGWIDVNANSKKDTNDTNLDITMKSYSKVVTPVTTYIADANVTLREQKLAALKERLNASGVGVDANLTESDLLGLPSEAKNLDFIVLTNAIYKDMQEHGGSLGSSDDDSVMSQFTTVAGLTLSTDPKDIEVAVIANLEDAGFTDYISSSEVEVEDSGSVDLSSYDVIMIYKNISSSENIIADQADEVNFGYKNSTASSSCLDYGFSNPQTSSNAGVSAKTYTSSDVTKLCVESDYSGSAYSGSVNITTYYNDSSSQNSDDDNVDDASDNNNDSGVSTGDDTFLSTKGTLYIYNNAGSDVNNLSSQLGMELYNASSPLHCTSYGFSNIITEKDETDGTHVITYFSDDNAHMCSEFDYAASSSNSGSTNIALYNN